MPNYTIEARSLSVAGVAGHDFWVLRDERGRAISELHGLATDRRTNEFIPIGTDSERHSLRIWEFVHDQALAHRRGVAATRDTFIRDDQPARTVLSADSREVMARWNAASRATGQLNALDLDYPNYGFRVFGSTVNSNSAYRTLGEIMGVPVRGFPGRIEPGLDNRMLPADQIPGLRAPGYPVLTEPRIDPEPRRSGQAPDPHAGRADLAYFQTLRGLLPASVSDDAVSYAMLRARQNGIADPSMLDRERTTAIDGNVYVMGRTPGFRASFDLAAVPPIEQTTRQLDALDRTRAPTPQAQQEPPSERIAAPVLGR